jgi:hypothetical protein
LSLWRYAASVPDWSGGCVVATIMACLLCRSSAASSRRTLRATARQCRQALCACWRPMVRGDPRHPSSIVCNPRSIVNRLRSSGNSIR